MRGHEVFKYASVCVLGDGPKEWEYNELVDKPELVWLWPGHPDPVTDMLIEAARRHNATLVVPV